MIEAAAAGPESYFLSYSRTDEAFAFRLARDVRAEGIHLWIDQLDIRPSEHWDRAIERAVSACQGIVVLLSPHSVASENVADEISFALNAGKTVLPVMIEPCSLPLRMTRMQLIDATGDYGKALQQCVAELRRSTEVAPVVPDTSAQLEDNAIPTAEVGRIARVLAVHLGPIATHLAKRESKACATLDQLAERLAGFIPSDAERADFLHKLRSR